MARQARLLLIMCLAALALWGMLALLAATPPIADAQQAALPQQPTAHEVLRAPLRRLTTGSRSTPLAWTPDGQTLLVKRPGRTLPEQQLAELWAVSANDGSQHRISDDAFYPAAHGDRLAYLRYVERGQWEAVLSDLAGHKAVSLGAARWTLPPAWVDGEVAYLDHAGRLHAPQHVQRFHLADLSNLDHARARLSGDGRFVALTDGRTLWVVSEAGQNVVARAGQIGGFAWSPAAGRLAYVRSDSGPVPELWLWDEVTDRSWMLLGGQLEHLGTPAWSPDGKTLAFARRPTGNGSSAAGDIWLVRTDGTDLRPLALTPADERAPIWSPNGQRLAFSLNGDVWIAAPHDPGLAAALDRATAEAETPLFSQVGTESRLNVAPLSLSAPVTIRVIHDDLGNTCRNVPDGQIDEYAFEDYVKRVLPNEVPALWPTETLKTQAVAARTYAWRKTIDRRSPYNDPGYDVWDSTRDQYLCDSPHPRTDAAADVTAGQYLSYDGKVLYAFFCAEAGSPTNYRQEFDLQAVPYLRPVDDPVSLGQARRGHSWGMSQWGAYRWAAWHGWTYRQILSHYYSFATVEPSSTVTEPLSGLLHPWPDAFVNTDRAYLQAAAADNSQVVSVTFASQVTETWTTLYTDTDAGDGWAYVWPVGHLTDTITPSIALRATVHDNAGNATTSEISYMGLHRTPPTGTLSISNTTVHTVNVVLSLSAVDPEPVSGTLRAGLGSDNWVWEDTDLYLSGGMTEADGAAVDGSAWHARSGIADVLFGPYTTVLPAARQYRALFRIRVPTAALTSALEIAKLDIATDDGETLLGIRYLRGTDFKHGSAYQEIAVDFDAGTGGGEVEFRTAAYGLFDLWVDRVRMVHIPTEVVTQTTWTLPAREGPVTVTAKIVDGAGNLSGDVPLALTLVDDSPPGEWRQFWCHGLTCTVQVRDAIAGLDVSSAAYRVSTDGGTSWSGWLSATCSGTNGSQAWETIAAAAVPFRAAVQFRVRDSAALPNAAQSPIYSLSHVFLPVATRDNP
jgi:stage II sporulation SpoD-like protein/WD40 repeat protein